jgi:hypothetical protein
MNNLYLNLYLKVYVIQQDQRNKTSLHYDEPLSNFHINWTRWLRLPKCHPSQCLLPIRFGFTSHKSVMAASAVARFLGVFGLLYLKDKRHLKHGTDSHVTVSVRLRI